jgi:hypothetical protein
MQRFIILICVLLLTSCSSLTKRVTTAPQEVLIVETKYVPIPSALLVPCETIYPSDDTVGEYVKTALFNTKSLEHCNNKLKLIKNLQP